ETPGRDGEGDWSPNGATLLRGSPRWGSASSNAGYPGVVTPGYYRTPRRGDKTPLLMPYRRLFLVPLEGQEHDAGLLLRLERGRRGPPRRAPTSRRGASAPPSGRRRGRSRRTEPPRRRGAAASLLFPLVGGEEQLGVRLALERLRPVAAAELVADDDGVAVELV